MRNSTQTVERTPNRLRVLLGGSFIMLCMLAVISLKVFETNSPGVSQALGDTAQALDGKVVVANRASGTISIIDVRSDEVIDTIPLPFDATVPEPKPEPMYVFYTPSQRRVFVDDRMNSRVVVFDADDFTIEDTIPTGRGAFHIWGDDTEGQLWVNNDIDNTITVINTNTLEVITTIPTPTDLVTEGSSGRPHDVILDPTDNTAFVTIIGVTGTSDFVIKYSTETFEELDRVAVGKDPHVSLAPQNDLLYVPCQGSSLVFVLNRDTLDQVTTIPIPGAHGAGMAPDGETFYTTNFPGNGIDGLFTIDTGTNTLVDTTSAPFAMPHNIVLTLDGRKLYLTHSSAALNKVTVYRVTSRRNLVPVFSEEVTVGLNPFGLAFVPTCGGRAATIVGTPAGETLIGTEEADVINGFGGNDTITGLGGNDIICGGSGRDTIEGGDERDLLLGQDGNDILRGNRADDTLRGGDGNDNLNGGFGADFCDGGAQISGDTASSCETVINVP